MALKCDKEYFINVSVIVETDCLPLLGMITSCSTPDIAMLRCIAYIKSLNLEFQCIADKDYHVADMLSRARYEDEEDMVVKGDDVSTKLKVMMLVQSSTPLLMFKKINVV